MIFRITPDEIKNIATDISTYKHGKKTVELRMEQFECMYKGTKFFYMRVQPIKVKGLPDFKHEQNFDACTLHRLQTIELLLKSVLINALGTPVTSSITTNYDDSET